MVEFLVSMLANVGAAAANFGSQACIFVIVDEEETPRSLIK